MNKHANKLQSTGVLAGIFALLCLPCLAAPLLITVGLSSILVFLGSWFTPILLALVAVSLVGFFLSFRMHHNLLPMILAIIAGIVLFYGRIISTNPYNQTPDYIGTGLIIAAVAADWYSRRQYKKTCEVCEVKPKKKDKE